MNECGLRFHHLGLAVREPESAIRTLEWLGYHVSESVFDPGQRVHLRLCESPSMPAIEIVCPAGDDSPAARFVRDQDHLVYHFCFSASSIDDAVEKIRSSGGKVVLLSDKKPAPLFGNRLVAFYYLDGMGIVELLENE